MILTLTVMRQLLVRLLLLPLPLLRRHGLQRWLLQEQQQVLRQRQLQGKRLDMTPGGGPLSL